jgi:catechol 2,3-dioxygenase-like lactoylglutathione lyase family enzyme
MLGKRRKSSAAHGEDTMIKAEGVHHLALVCKDMDRTVKFYTEVMGMPLTAKLSLAGGAKHFFFDMGGGNQLAFFYFPDAPAAQPGISSAALNGFSSGVASMNHVAFTVPDENALWDAWDDLKENGVKSMWALDHDFCKSIYFRDPDGILLEFACWVRPLDERDLDETRPTKSTIIQRPVPVPVG